MDNDVQRTQDFVDNPRESLNIELKRWIDPDQPEGIAKIAKAALALRNVNGGHLVIGFDDKTLQPHTEDVPSDVQSAFHIDKIQAIVSKYASEPFEISIEFPERNGQQHPVIVVSPGVKTPVAAKRDLNDGNGKPLICKDALYVRSLRSNNTPSTTKATCNDWPNIVDICFDNREADIGRFVRRHLSGISPDIIKEFASSLTEDAEPMHINHQLLGGCLEIGKRQYEQKVDERKIHLPNHGAWEVALIIGGEVPEHTATKEFLNLLASSNPNYTGWPVWLDSRGFTNESSRPYPYEEVWEAILAKVESSWDDHIDFMRLDPRGRFYLYRALQDDISGNNPRAPEPLKALDAGLSVVRTAEAIAVGLAFSKAMGCKSEKSLLSFAFRWSGLRGRILSSWAWPRRDIRSSQPASQDDVTAYVNVPLDTPLSALGEYVNQVIEPLFRVFGGFELDKEVVEDLTRGLIERRR